MSKYQEALNKVLYDNPKAELSTSDIHSSIGLLQELIDKHTKLEEELGCPLDIVFKALMNGFYLWNGNDYFYWKTSLHYHAKLKKWFWLDTGPEIKDYGDRWWLKIPKEERND